MRASFLPEIYLSIYLSILIKKPYSSKYPIPAATSTAMSSSLPLAVAATVPVAGGALLPMSTPVEAAIVQVQGGAVYQEAHMSTYAPMSAEQALAIAEAEGLIMPRSNGKTGFRGVTHVTGKKARPYQAWICRAGKLERLGRFATPEEAALCRARTPEGQKAASRCAAPRHMCARPPALRTHSTRPAFEPCTCTRPVPDPQPVPPTRHRSSRGGKSSPAPMTLEEAEAQAEAAEAQAEAEGLTLVRSENQTGYLGVYVNTSNKVKPFEACACVGNCVARASASWLSAGCVRRQSMPQAARSLGQPRPASASLGQPRPASANLGQPRPTRHLWGGEGGEGGYQRTPRGRRWPGPQLACFRHSFRHGRVCGGRAASR
jgi:hypothetical protein